MVRNIRPPRLNGGPASPGRRSFAVLAASAALPAWGQSYPWKPLQVVIPTPPGSGADILARLLAEPLRGRLGQPLIVESKSGATGTIAAAYVASAPPDGHTLLLTYGIQALAPIAYRKLPYRPFDDFAPVAQLARVPLVAVVPASMPAKTLGEFVELAKSSKGKFNYASTGKGALNHLVAESLNLDAGTGMVHVPYKGGGPAIQAVASNETQIYFSSYAGVKGLVQAGKLRILCTTARARLADLPDVQTARESGFAGLDAYDWFGILAPAATPAAAVGTLHKTIVEVLRLPELRGKLADFGYEIAEGSADDFGALIRDEYARWGARAKQANIQFDE